MYQKAHFNWDDLPPLTSPRKQLGLRGVALGLINLPAGQGYTFTHSHREQEEVYMVLEGSGLLWIDGEAVPLVAGDMVRVAAEARRALKSDDDGPLRIICAGAVPAGFPKQPGSRYLIDDGVPDYDDIPPWYANNEEVAANNRRLKERYLRSLARRREREDG